MPEIPRVRLAMPAEAAAIAEVQRAAWSSNPLLAPAIAGLSLADATQIWHQVIVRPPLAHYRVLVALDEHRVVGFAFIGPSDDGDADPTDSLVHEFAIAGPDQRRGHGARLMQAAVDTMRLDGYERATWWVGSSDDVLRGWSTQAGWAPDGAHREIGDDEGGVRLKQVRLHTDIRTDDPA